MTRARLRDLGITVGRLPTGPYNAITDVPGVLVGHRTLVYDEPRIARTGVTVIVPRQGQIWQDNAFAACHAFNGTGEMTGMHWLAESGMLCYPVALTTTHHIGTVHEALVAYGMEKGFTSLSSLAVVAETWDGFLNDLDAFHLKKEDVYLALANAKSGPVAEGNVGGGTGMICHDFKGGSVRLRGWWKPAVNNIRSGCWCRPTTATGRTCAWTASRLASCWVRIRCRFRIGRRPPAARSL